MLHIRPPQGSTPGSETSRKRTWSAGIRGTSPSFNAAVSWRLASTHSGSDGYARCVVDPVEEDRHVVLLHVLVNGPAGSLPVGVVVDDEDAGGRDQRVEVHESVLGGRVPIRVEAKQRDFFRCIVRQGFLHG